MALATVLTAVPMVTGFPQASLTAQAHPVKSNVRHVGFVTSSIASMRTARNATRSALTTPGAKDPMATARAGAVTGVQDVAGAVTVVGVTWPHGAVSAKDQFQIRTLTGTAWGQWQELGVRDGGPDGVEAAGSAAAAVGGTDPYVVTGASKYQVRSLTADATVPASTTVQAVDPGTSSADDVQPAAGAASAATVKPLIYPRAAWGANESLRRAAPAYAKIMVGYVHHTDSANSYAASEVPAMIRGIYAYHVQSQGWNDIGYNFLVDRFGRIWEGRYGGMEKAVVGAHTLNYNSVSMGVSAIGNYDIGAVPQAMTNAFKRIFAWKFSLAGIPATGTVLAGGKVFQRVSGHRDAFATACPGRYLYAKLPEIRTGTAAIIATSPQVLKPVVKPPVVAPIATLRLSGHGFGHGHGMSQWGAYGAASVGKLSWQSILAYYYPGTKLSNLGNPTIRVRLDAVGSGSLSVYNAAGLRLGGKVLPAGAITQYRARSLPAGGRMQVDALSAAGWKPYVTTASPAVFSSTTALVAVQLASGARRLYRGSVYAHWATATSVRTVSVLPMESYLRAVVPAEMPASWHPNALRAQAVAARSYANYDRTHAPAGRTYDTCDTNSCQMYSGVPAEYALSSAAVAATAGQTLTFGGAAAFTQFGAANGGWMSAGSRAYLVAKADPYDGAIPNGANTWTATISRTAIQARWPSIGTYRQLRVLSRDGGGQWGGRVLTAAIDGSKGSVAVTGASIRAAFGLRSEWFTSTASTPVPKTIPTITSTKPSVAASSTHDFNGDRRADVLAVRASTGALWMYAGNGAAGWKSASVVATGFRGISKVFTAGTWNADARPDVMAVRPDGTLWLDPGSASGLLGSPRRIGVGWGVYDKIFSAGDFNGDGHSDLIARQPNGVLKLHLGDGLGGFRGVGRQIGAGWNRFNVILSPGDFNGDGKADVIVRTSGGLLYLYPGNGSGAWLPPRLIGKGWNTFSTIISPGDLNGDGKSDLLGRDSSGALVLRPGNGTGGFLPSKVVGSGWNAFSTIVS